MSRRAISPGFMGSRSSASGCLKVAHSGLSPARKSSSGIQGRADIHRKITIARPWPEGAMALPLDVDTSQLSSQVLTANIDDDARSHAGANYKRRFAAEPPDVSVIEDRSPPPQTRRCHRSSRLSRRPISAMVGFAPASAIDSRPNPSPFPRPILISSTGPACHSGLSYRWY